jgi:putative ABC transport system ATP-binding protein
MQPLVQLTEVTKVYGGGRAQPALAGVTLNVAAGEVLAVMGPSGSGKSTLLNVIGGLDRATSGAVRVDGSDLARMSEAALARFRRTRVGMIFQFFNLLDSLTALDNVMLPAQLNGARDKAARRRAEELLARLGIDALRNAYPATMSGGERQRVAIARALVNRPLLLLADEPTGALDTRTGEGVLEILADLSHGGQTIVLVTHDPRLASRVTSRAVRIVDGRVVEPEAELAGAR